MSDNDNITDQQQFDQNKKNNINQIRHNIADKSNVKIDNQTVPQVNQSNYNTDQNAKASSSSSQPAVNVTSQNQQSAVSSNNQSFQDRQKVGPVNSNQTQVEQSGADQPSNNDLTPNNYNQVVKQVGSKPAPAKIQTNAPASNQTNTSVNQTQPGSQNLNQQQTSSKSSQIQQHQVDSGQNQVQHQANRQVNQEIKIDHQPQSSTQITRKKVVGSQQSVSAKPNLPKPNTNSLQQRSKSQGTTGGNQSAGTQSTHPISTGNTQSSNQSPRTTQTPRTQPQIVQPSGQVDSQYSQPTQQPPQPQQIQQTQSTRLSKQSPQQPQTNQQQVERLQQIQAQKKDQLSPQQAVQKDQAKVQKKQKLAEAKVKPEKIGTKKSRIQPPSTKSKKKRILIFLLIFLFIVVGAAALIFFSGKLFSNLNLFRDDFNFTFSFLGIGGDKGQQTFSQDTTSTEAVAETKVDLVYWGFWDEDVINPIIASYQQQNPGIKIHYEKKTLKDYRANLESLISSNDGPDIYRYHASWVPIMERYLATVPEDVMTVSEFRETFYPVASKQLIQNNKIFGIPLMYDGLILLYNQRMFQNASVAVPKDWSEVIKAANDLTIPIEQSLRSNDSLQRGGIALGISENVDYFSDVLTLLIKQNNGDPSEPDSKAVEQVLKFYTDFHNKYQVWGKSFPDSIKAFTDEDVAMIFAKYEDINRIKEANPELNFGVASVPKLSSDRVGLASYWVEGVSSKSKHKQESFHFLDYLSSIETLQQLYKKQKQSKFVGEVYSRVDLSDNLVDNQYASALLTDAPYATYWYMNDYTQDLALNDDLKEEYGQAVTAYADVTTRESAIKDLTLQVEAILKTFDLE